MTYCSQLGPTLELSTLGCSIAHNTLQVLQRTTLGSEPHKDGHNDTYQTMFRSLIIHVYFVVKIEMQGRYSFMGKSYLLFYIEQTVQKHWEVGQIN